MAFFWLNPNDLKFLLKLALRCFSEKWKFEIGPRERPGVASFGAHGCSHPEPETAREAPIHLECQFHQEINLPCTLKNSINTMIIGEVLGIHIKDEVLSDGIIDLNKIKPLARLGYQQYTAVDNVFAMTRPKQ